MLIKVIDGRDIDRHRDLMDAVFKLRFEHFVVRRRWALPCRDGRDIDQYDGQDAIYLVVLDDDGLILACSRLNQTSRCSLLADLFPHLIETGEDPRSATLYEGTRFALSPSLRSRTDVRRARSLLGCAAAQLVLERGGTQIQAVVDYSAFQAFVEMSLRTRPLGLPQAYGGGPRVPGGGRCIAFRWDLTPELITDFREYGRTSPARETVPSRHAHH